MEATDRPAVRTIVAERRIDVANVVEEQVVREAAIRSTRPIAAVEDIDVITPFINDFKTALETALETLINK